MSGMERVASRAGVQVTRFTMSNFLFGFAAVSATTLVAAAVGGLVGIIYQRVAYGAIVNVQTQIGVGLVVGLLYCATFLYGRAYTIPAYLSGAHRPARIFVAWNAAFLAMFVIAFLTQTTVSLSRIQIIAFYAAGLLAMIAVEGGLQAMIMRCLATDVIPPRRVMLIGGRTETDEFSRRLETVSQSERLAVRIVATAEVDRVASPETLAEALATARALLPDEIVILTPWGNPTMVDSIVAAFEQLPVAIHLDGGPVLARFSEPHLRRVGGVSTVSVAELPLTPVQAILKRAFDIVGATLGLILLSPLFALIAIAIKRETRDSVFFKQDRLGFNQQTFRIYKFRSMTSSDNGTVVEQVRPNDVRVTRIGRILRRTSLDELPQLINVLKGEMSLVGPRPHAVAHDRTYEHRIRSYPRRLNIKPGMTGWAQVNGLRGLTDTDDKMRRRVEYDLYYIDNWSLWFDVYIIILTVLSPKTFNNAA